MVSKIAISIPEDLLVYLDLLAKKWETTRSGAIAKVLHQVKMQDIEESMKEGYLAMAEENLAEAEFCFPAQSEVILRGD